MKTSTLAASPLGAPFDLLTEQGTEGAIIEISHSVTSDSPDGQPWPPSDSNALYALTAARFGGQSSLLSPIRCNFSDRQQPNLKDHYDDER